MSKYNLSETITEMYAKYVPLKSWEHTAKTVISVTAFVLLFFQRPNSFSLFQRSYVKRPITKQLAQLTKSMCVFVILGVCPVAESG